MLLRLAAGQWPAELPLIQPASGQPDAEAVANQDLHAVGAAIGEQVNVMGMRSAEHLDHSRPCRVETGAHVQRFHCQPGLINPDHLSRKRLAVAVLAC